MAKKIATFCAAVTIVPSTAINLRQAITQELSSNLAECSDSVAQAAYDLAMPSIIDAFNEAWPSLASSSNIDPLTGVTIPNINIPCKDYGDYFCGLQTMSCEKTWVQMDFSYLDGLGNFEITTYDLGDIEASTSSCSSSDLPSGATCSYSASPSLVSKLSSGELEVELKNLKFKAKCKDMFGGKHDETIASVDTLKCTSSNAEASAVANICGSSCNIYDASVSKVEISDSTKISCDASGYPSWIIDPIVSGVQDSIYDVLNPIIEKEMNVEFDDVVGDGYPSSTCS